jgi:hypothetical protein
MRASKGKSLVRKQWCKRGRKSRSRKRCSRSSRKRLFRKSLSLSHERGNKIIIIISIL